LNHYNCRIALRLASNEKEEMEELIRKRKFKNLSQVIRAALNEFLKKSKAETSQGMEENA